MFIYGGRIIIYEKWLCRSWGIQRCVHIWGNIIRHDEADTISDHKLFHSCAEIHSDSEWRRSCAGFKVVFIYGGISLCTTSDYTRVTAEIQSYPELRHIESAYNYVRQVVVSGLHIWTTECKRYVNM